LIDLECARVYLLGVDVLDGSGLAIHWIDGENRDVILAAGENLLASEVHGAIATVATYTHCPLGCTCMARRAAAASVACISNGIVVNSGSTREATILQPIHKELALCLRDT